MAPIQQFVSTAASNSRSTSDLTTGSTRDFVNSVHKVKENYSSNSSSISSSSHSDAAHSSMTGSRPGDATQQETLLPISSRGHFFSDAFFEDARQHFESAVRKVLERRGHSRSSVHDDLTSYRMLRQADLSESTQAATVTENATCHQVVMDVRDFMAGDVKVKVVDEDEVVVEGSVGHRSGGSVSQKSFRRSFTFPGLVKAADITSTMSSDGVLTVTVPKKEHVGKITNITVQEYNTPSRPAAGLPTASRQDADFPTASRPSVCRPTPSRPAACWRPAAGLPTASREVADFPTASRPVVSRPTPSRPAACWRPAAGLPTASREVADFPTASRPVISRPTPSKQAACWRPAAGKPSC
ncbi:microtubule-actin cross-linking factor 1, isoforms 6/7-like [Eriocheir sinensis]|uniref:microtubule-actin cross-linking factor 1, isoforms 6/7-like n=1 Tax=Eriocheir sinensis TaxID=95602 RepID=UPI0021C86B20|nr:microtubule-actin cross-linking factor 1, isoforms 6/7-like [Eriocheir sinensis]